MWASIWAISAPWCSRRNRWVSASRKAGIFGRSLPFANSANTAGSSSPASSAARIARPVLPRIVEATEVSLIPASCSTFSRRWIARVRSSVSRRPCRVTSRNSRTLRGGTKLGDTSPCSISWAIHIESATSVLRPGTFRRCSALITQTGNLSSST